MRYQRLLLPFSGLCFAIVLVLSTALSPGGASSNDPAAKIAAYYTLGAIFELAATAIELALAANAHAHAPATTAAALYQVASRLFSMSTLGIGAAVGTTALCADTKRWLPCSA